MSLLENFIVYKINKDIENKQKELITIERADRFKRLLGDNKVFYMYQIHCVYESKTCDYLSFTFDEGDILDKKDLMEVYDDDYCAFLSKYHIKSDTYETIFEDNNYLITVFKFKLPDE